MKQPMPAKNKGPIRVEGLPPRREPVTPRGVRTDLKIRYSYRMKPQRVYPLTVDVPGSSVGRPGQAGGDFVTVRPIIPGALVAPPEQRLDVARPGSRVSFAVTPLAKGRLPGPRVEFLHNGRVVHDVGLSMKTTTQRMTWLLLLLTLIVPPLLLYFGHYHPLAGTVKRQIKRPVSEEDKKKLVGNGPENKPGEGEKGDRQPAAGGQVGGGGVAAETKPIGDTYTEWVERPATPGEVLTDRLDTLVRDDVPTVPDLQNPSNPDWLNNMLASVGSAVNKPHDAWLPAAGRFLGSGYEIYIGLADVQVTFWVAVALLLLTIASWAMHRRVRSSRRTFLELAPAGAGAQAQETLPLNPSAPSPPAAEPAS
jgi:hypothetical protein